MLVVIKIVIAVRMTQRDGDSEVSKTSCREKMRSVNVTLTLFPLSNLRKQLF